MTMYKGAQISDCGNYRYELSRIWDTTKPKVLFIGLNPSTADAKDDDATIRRLIKFTEAWGYGGFYIGNLFALRSRYPQRLKVVDDPVGPLNNYTLRILSNNTAFIVGMWGNNGTLNNRDQEVLTNILSGYRVYCFGKNQDGSPKHPLYLKADIKPMLLTK